jgi:hypothetical protein
MSRSHLAASLLFAAICILFVPNPGSAQSIIAGVVKDATGAVLPGVTVEASSDVLIEKTRSAVTDGQGQYRITALRPGAYVVTFTLTGFQTVKRENVDLPGEFTATVNAEMKIGAVAETIAVSGAAPTVDVQSAAHIQTLDREAIDSIPTGRTIQGIGQIVVGINLSLPDVGGSRAAMQTYMSVHGQSAANNTVMVDGMTVNGLESNGQVQSYFNDAMNQEMTYQTAGIAADVSAGGVRLNMIPKEGGNRFSGSSGLAFRPGKLQGNNLTPRLQTAGLTAGNSTEYISDFTAAEGGPLVKDTICSSRPAATTAPATAFRTRCSTTANRATTTTTSATRWSGSPGRRARITSSPRTTTGSASIAVTTCRATTILKPRRTSGRRRTTPPAA